jgi:hypothetical protein
VATAARWMRSALLALGVLAASASCATTGRFRTVMNTWLNGDVNAFIMSWGAPSQTTDLPNGTRMYTFMMTGGTVANARYNRYLRTTTATATTYWCQVNVTADRTGRIIAWQANGNACRSR